MIDERTEMYLKAIGQTEEEGESATTSGLARDLDVSMPSVTEMLQRLAAKGLVIHEPRGPIRLSEEGQRLASSLMRRHRLWENFLVHFLGLPWDKVHEEACRLEHATSPELEERLASFLGDLETCPHGHTIPSRDGRRKAQPAVPLTEFQPPGPARVVRIRREARDFLRRLARLNIEPGRVLSTEGTRPRDGAVRVRVEGHSRQVAPELAQEVMVEPAQAPEVLADTALPLSELRSGDTATVVGILGGRTFRARALSLGCTPGTKVKVVRNPGSGPLVVTLGDTRVALEHGEAEHLRVKRIEAGR
jgi:DtxR family Mn-dependent transcriptional regulator